SATGKASAASPLAATAVHGSATVTTLTCASRCRARSKPAATAFPASSDPSVAMRMFLYMIGPPRRRAAALARHPPPRLRLGRAWGVRIEHAWIVLWAKIRGRAGIALDADQGSRRVFGDDEPTIPEDEAVAVAREPGLQILPVGGIDAAMGCWDR